MFTSKNLLRVLARRFLSSTPIKRHGPKLTAASADEMSHFNALASSWWDVNGPQRILHKMNLLRMDYINEMVRSHLKLNKDVQSPDDEIYIPPFNVDLLPTPIKSRILQEQDEKRDEILMDRKLKALDVGCGGGILAESLARLRYVESVKGIDLSTDVLEAAKVHLKEDPELESKLTYSLQAVEDLPINEKYDIITVFEMLEHVQYPSKVLSEVFDRVEDGGWVFLSTINRDFVSWFTTIFMGEHVLKIVPVGTHTLEKYINEKEIRQWVEQSKYKETFEVTDSRGCIYLPAYGWKFTECAEVGNYFMAIQKIK
ncbi:CIC11C00000001260 [Sungouiella intermedia]|uniref:Ubiquinone biosynthesis O-methyltransferase, mitochondrial n=1 Tax=Sungouiella intermedia TaxID=45354 RepID=A0A1L0CWX9_9ASCO|nr:CIC11C00000001260 [[Candida] intermedia]SGZ58148.1 CIC11C00000002274 [[Candida] intermedia]